MSIKGHATLLKIMSAIWVVGMAVGGFLLWNEGHPGATVALVFGGVLTMVLMWELLLDSVSIECDQPGCHGRVGHKWVSDQPFHWIVRYVCEDCGHETDAPISFTFGGGNSWD